VNFFLIRKSNNLYLYKMAKGVNPLIYRLGFFRNWDSLFTESLYVRNYNYFLKTQMINFYIDGFFKKWAWDGRRSYFLNIIYSHSEISWSYKQLNLIVYIYNTGSEIIFYRFLKEIKVYLLKKQILNNFNISQVIAKTHNLCLSSIFSNDATRFKKKIISYRINDNLKKFFNKTSITNKVLLKKRNSWIKSIFLGRKIPLKFILWYYTYI